MNIKIIKWIAIILTRIIMKLNFHLSHAWSELSESLSQSANFISFPILVLPWMDISRWSSVPKSWTECDAKIQKYDSEQHYTDNKTWTKSCCTLPLHLHPLPAQHECHPLTARSHCCDTENWYQRHKIQEKLNNSATKWTHKCLTQSLGEHQGANEQDWIHL